MMEEQNIQCPDWLNIDDNGKKKVNEVEFCKMFLQTRYLKCIGGQFRTLSGDVDEEEIKHEIAQILMEHITVGVYNKVKSLMGILKLRCYSEPPEVTEDEIHLLNGILRTNGDFIPEQRFCTNRLNIDDKGKKKVNEVEFCKMFLQNRRLKCIGGQFRSLSGDVDEEVIKHEIAQILMEHIEEGVFGKVGHI